MNALYIKIASVVVVVLCLQACSKQPSEMQKAQVEQQILGCLSSVTTQIGEDPGGLFDGLTAVKNKITEAGNGKFSKPKWKLSEGENVIVTMELELTDTRYSCDYVEEGNGFALNQVKRNGELVFDREENKNNLAENERLLKVAAEEKRQQLIKVWAEKSYSNVAYKYYEKQNQSYSEMNFGAPSFRIICNPEGTRFEYDTSNFNEIRDKAFVFAIDNQDKEHKFDVTDSGRIGKYNKDNWLNNVVFDSARNDEFLGLLQRSTSVKVDGFEWKIDDLSVIPCLN